MPPLSISAIGWPRISTNCGADILAQLTLPYLPKLQKEENRYNYWIWLWQQQ
jgi:hypothetical protein